MGVIMETIFTERRAFWIWFAVVVGVISIMTLSHGVGASEEDGGYVLPLSKDAIDNYDDFVSRVPLSPKEVRLLEENGFVVIIDPFSPNRDDMAAPYKILRKLEVPIYVSADSLLHAYHIQFAETLRGIEEDHFYDDLWSMTGDMLAKSEAEYEASSGEAKEAAKMNVAFFSVAKSLLAPRADQLCPASPRECDPKSFEGAYPYFTPEEIEEKRFEVPPLVAEAVKKELAFIRGGAGFGSSLIFGYDEDYSQYTPRGHYTRSERLKNYFQAMIWYGRMGFLLKGCEEGCIVSEQEARVQTLAAAMIAENLLDDPASRERWDRIYDVTSFYVGFADDLGPYEYNEAIDRLFGPVPAKDLSVDDLSLLKAALAEERPPRIFGGTGVDSPACMIEPPFTPQQADDCLAATAGLRFLGQRFVPDSYIFQKLVIPNVGGFTGEGDPFTRGPYGRHFPRGLDVMAVLGSARADEILASLKDSSYVDYPTRRAELAEEFGTLTEEDWQRNLYWSWLYALRPLLQEAEAESPAFMKTVAWQDKSLTTALASWTELRHDTILYAKQSYTLRAISMPPEEPEAQLGFVEPVPEVYNRLLLLARMNREVLEEAGLLDDLSESRLERLETILTKLEEISRAQLAGRPLAEEEVEFIADFAETLNSVMEGVDDRSKKTTVVADVHTDANSGLVLEEAVGYVRIAVVAFDDPDGVVRLAAGPVYSYYEFLQPLDERLTDEGWREMLAKSPPADPEWTGSFAGWLPPSVLGAEPKAEGVKGAADIRLEEFEVRIGWNLREGWYADCTITLANSGDAEGTANVILEDGEGNLLRELVVVVPEKSTVTERAKVDISGRNRQVNSKLVEG
ncbi:DUF3160 domain-containing protein [Candidatus Methanocrinis natronophilus]|uniref:DUF3160 domain-containing protein n=1 Tax=Candidatus Methanocrinis natronophilus TaxID=3033396 RepID=A0ABT5X7P5_9EURY|nr:DUF3160 domain-containing protein [Candidatus Methanocrinis natronophilus]MDF0590715.1 DUF3160 domain-containing protein [Candidatus Methanocrinis natronophilus]